jgi:hypothetical protein
MSTATASAVPRPGPEPRRWDWVLVGLLVVSFALRLILALHGGQRYYPDESRFSAAIEALKGFDTHSWHDFAEPLVATADHLGYKILMLPVAWGAYYWHWSLPLLAMLSSGIFSTANVAWVYALARRKGGGRAEARWSALFMAASCSMFYWSRHLMPYDLALFLGLAALFVSVHPSGRWFHSLAAGFLGFATFVTYNGYWSLVAFVLTAHVLSAWPGSGKFWAALGRAWWALVGLVLPFVGLLFLARGFGYYLLDSYMGFSGTISQGDFGDGHTIVAEYLWAAEKGLCLVWLVCAAKYLFSFRTFPAAERARFGLWLAGALGIALGLILLCDVVHKFVVYGRLVRQVVPFASLLAGGVVAAWLPRRPAWQLAVAAGIVAMAAGNFWQPLAQRWNFHELALRTRDRYLNARHELTPDRFMILNENFIWPTPVKYDLPPYEVLLSEPHVLQFRPLLYEGFNRAQRKEILATDITMRLVLLPPRH